MPVTPFASSGSAPSCTTGDPFPEGFSSIDTRFSGLPVPLTGVPGLVPVPGAGVAGFDTAEAIGAGVPGLVPSPGVVGFVTEPGAGVPGFVPGADLFFAPGAGEAVEVGGFPPATVLVLTPVCVLWLFLRYA